MASVLPGWVGYNGRQYRVRTNGNGYTISVDRLISVGYLESRTIRSVFFAQGDDAAEFVEILEKQGEAALLSYLDGAGVEI